MGPSLFPLWWEVAFAACVLAGLALARAYREAGRARWGLVAVAALGLWPWLAPVPGLFTGDPHVWIVGRPLAPSPGQRILVDSLGCSGTCRQHRTGQVLAVSGEPTPAEIAGYYVNHRKAEVPPVVPPGYVAVETTTEMSFGAPWREIIPIGDIRAWLPPI